jgi:predicted Rdx family selenoprotein
VRTVAELLHDYQHVIEEFRVVTGSKGVFDVIVDGQVLFSKGQVGRHAGPGEVLTLFRQLVGQDVAVYERH